MRGLKVFGFILLAIGAYLIILSMLLPAPASITIVPSSSHPPATTTQGGGGGVSGGYAGCVILFFIPICFSGGSMPSWVPAAFIGAFIAFIVLFFIMVAAMFRRARAPQPPYV